MSDIKFVANKSKGVRRGKWKGRDHIIVQVAMLTETVVNGALVPFDQLNANAWNGVPVTLNHPTLRGVNITANSPDVMEEWQVGTIFNSKVSDGKLRAEAWVDIELADEKLPGLVDRLESGEPMDVSTGYFPTALKQSGVHNGKAYKEVHTELKPDHLALLPDDVGACSFTDGCGVRVNKKSEHMPGSDDEKESKGVMSALAKLLTNIRGSDDDRRQIVADLISSDDTPFSPDSMWALQEMPDAELKRLRDDYLKPAPVDNKSKPEGGTPVSDKDKPEAVVTNSAKVADMTVEQLTALITNTASTSATKAVEEALATNKKVDLITKLVANTDLGLTECELKVMPLSALEKLAANADKAKTPAPKTPTNFAGRGLRTNSDDGTKTAPKFAGMVNNSAEFLDKKKEA